MLLSRFCLLVLTCFSLCSCASDIGGEKQVFPIFADTTPPDAKAYSDFLIARYAAMTDDPKTAASHYASALENTPKKADIAERAVFTTLLSGDYDETRQLAKKADAFGSDAALVQLVLGVDELKRGRTAAAQDRFDPGKYSSFNRVIVRMLKAWSLVSEGQVEAAEAYLNRNLIGDPSLDSLTLYMVGLIQMSDGRDDDALKTFNILWNSGARLAIGVEAQAELLAARDEIDEALDLIDEFQGTIGGNAALEDLRQRIEAAENIQPTRLSPQQGAARAIYVPAAALLNYTDDDLSVIYFVLAVELDKELHAARALWAKSLDNAGRYDDAIKVLKDVPETSAFYATAQGQMAWALRRLERNSEALATAKNAVASQGDRGLKVQLADLFRSLEQYDQSETLLDEIIDDDKAAGREDWRVIFARGTVRERQGKWDLAKPDLERAAALMPNNPTVLNYLGYSYVMRGTQLVDGFELIRKALRFDPQSGYVLDSLGWAYYQLGQYDEAVAYLEQAASIEPGIAEINDHLGDAYWKMGRKTEARFQWRRAASQMPDGTAREAVELKLDAGLISEDRKSASAPILRPMSTVEDH